MSGWGLGWFGGGGAAKKKDAPKNAILQLRGQLEMLSKREKHLQHQMDEQDAIARKNVSTNKTGKAIYFLLAAMYLPRVLSLRDCNIFPMVYRFSGVCCSQVC